MTRRLTPAFTLDRRALLAGAAGAAAGMLGGLPTLAKDGPVLRRPIPSSGELLPVIGIGTAIIFDFKDDPAKLAERTEVLGILAKDGGHLIDTAPSYGNAEVVLGDIISRTGLRDRLFLATKVAVAGREATIAEMKRSQQRMRTEKFDLMQLWNVRNPDQDLALLREWKAEGLCRYVGMTSSFDRDYAAVEATLKREKPDFFQIDYSLGNRNAEERLLPAARDVGAAVLTNLPFGRGSLFRKVRGQKVPEWAAEFDAATWGQFFLKYLIANETVNAVIPGTDKPEYMVDNLNAGRGRLPDAAMRKRMISFIDGLPG